MKDQLIRSEEFRERLGGISRTTLYRMIQKGVVPEPIKLGENSANYFKDSWIDEIINEESK